MKIDKTVGVIDHGLYVHIAELMARYFKNVVYFAEWRRSFPSSDLRLVGEGLKGIHRAETLGEVEDSCDLFVFPDLYWTDLQARLRQEGRPVWGAGNVELIETQRDYAKGCFESWGMPVNDWERIVGLDKLREHLLDKEDRYIKSLLRGNFETFHHENYVLTEPFLDELEHRLGKRKDSEVFIVETPINEAIEIGYDGFHCGDWPSVGIAGYEAKDCGYLGAVMPYEKIGKPVRYVNEYLHQYFKGEGQNDGFWISTEVRIPEKGDPLPYLIDPCIRCGSPCSEGYAEAYSNWGDIVDQGSKGVLVNPEVEYQYLCELVIKSPWAKENWLAVHVPEQLQPMVKLHYKCRIEDTDYVVPVQPGIEEVGAVVGCGKTIQEAVEMAIDISKEVKGCDIHFDYGSINPTLSQIHKGIGMGIPFGDGKVPEHIEI